jgi:hypothetical protein
LERLAALFQRRVLMPPIREMMEPAIANRPKGLKIGIVTYDMRYNEKERNIVESATIVAPKLTCFSGHS